MDSDTAVLCSVHTLSSATDSLDLYKRSDSVSSPTCSSPARGTPSVSHRIENQTSLRRYSFADPDPDSSAQHELTSHIFSEVYDDLEDQYMLHDKLGNGSMGVVRRCSERSSGREWACKTIPKALLKCQDDVFALIDEVEAMLALGDHCAIIGLHDVLEDSQHVHIVMELCEGGELFDAILRRKRYPEKDAARVIRSVISAVQYMHSLGFAHSDLKPENVVLASPSSDTRVRVVDFGHAARVVPGHKLSKFVGSALYVSPEIIVGEYGPETDIWSTGVMLYVLLCGSPPFYAPEVEGIYSQILAGEVSLDWGPWKQISDDAKDLVQRMLTRDLGERITARQIKHHPWILKHCPVKTPEPRSPTSPVSVLNPFPCRHMAKQR